MTRSAIIVLAALFFPAAVATAAQAIPATLPAVGQPVVPADPILTAAENLIGEALFLRGFYAANDLRYDANGKVEGSPKSTDWTLAAFNCLKAEREGPDQIELEGVRTAIRYNPDAHEFQRHPLSNEKMKLFIKLSPATTDATKGEPDTAGAMQANPPGTLQPNPVRQLRAAFAAIFAIGIDPALQRSMPPLWSHFFNPNVPWEPDALAGQVIYTINYPSNGPGQPAQPQGVTAPLLTHRVDSRFTDSAVRDKVKGQVQLRVVVDAQGLPQRIVVAHPLGYGLDQQAAEAVAKWRFDPALLAGKQVASAIAINLDFEPVPGR